MPKLTINDIEIEVAPGTSILQAAEQLGIEIPRFCYHDKLSVPANCRMCLVEVSPGPPKPQASCALACADGMNVQTDSALVKKARKGVMEFLLINHPLDCPICDQGGECDLQDQAVSYGFDRSRYHENKRAVPNKEVGPLIKTIMTRCIQCTRCVRFGEEIGGMTELGLMHRGEDVEIDTFIGKSITTELSGNMIDICPVGALTSKPYAFKARSWELSKTESIDVHDAVGCNIRVDSRGGEVMRILPRLHEDINEEWINDRTRFAYDGLKRSRLDRPWLRDPQSGALREATWEEALSVLSAKLQQAKPDKIAALAGDLVDVESVVALKDLLGLMGAGNLECRIDGARFDPAERAGYIFNTTIAGLEEADAILLVGTNPRREATLVNARIRKTWLNRHIPVGLVGAACDLTYPYEHLGETPQDLEKLMTSRSGFAKTLKDAKNPVIIAGMGAFCREDGLAIHALLHDMAEHFGAVRDDWCGFSILHDAAGRVGALDVGFYSGDGFDLGAMDVVYLLGADDFDMAQIAPESFVIYQGHHGDNGAHRADMILPGATYTEKDALYVNMEGRVQMARRAVHPPGQAREDWKIIRALSDATGHSLPYNDLLELRERIALEWPHLGVVDVAGAAVWGGFGEAGKTTGQKFKPTIENFYITNAITRASATMKKCAQSLMRDECITEKQDMEAAE